MSNGFLYSITNTLSISSLTQPPDASFQPPDATFSIFQECQSSESEVLVWVSPNHSSSTRDLEKPILALPLHWIGPLLHQGGNVDKRSKRQSVYAAIASQSPKGPRAYFK